MPNTIYTFEYSYAATSTRKLLVFSTTRRSSIFHYQYINNSTLVWQHSFSMERLQHWQQSWSARTRHDVTPLVQ